MPNPVQQPAAKYNTMPQFMQQPNWTDVVLIRVRFSTQDMCICFIQNFNRFENKIILLLLKRHSFFSAQLAASLIAVKSERHLPIRI
jgi:hypothetical protein